MTHTHTHTPTQTDIGCVHMCIVHHTSTLNDKLCINLNLLTFILNVLILILLINTHFFHFGYLLFKETSTKWIYNSKPPVPPHKKNNNISSSNENGFDSVFSEQLLCNINGFR